jgi:hypothetical protein
MSYTAHISATDLQLIMLDCEAVARKLKQLIAGMRVIIAE